MTTMTVAGRSVEISHGDKVLFPEPGITKHDVVDYYRRIASRMLPHLRDRPLAIARYPDGIERSGFLQKQVPDYFPDWIDTATLEKREGGTTTYIVCNDAASLVYVANQAAIVPHGLLCRSDRPERPDQLVFDFDPPGADDRHLDHVRCGAGLVGELLRDAGLTPYVKSSGSRGLHVHALLDRRADFEESRALAHDVARRAVEQEPDRLTVEHSKSRRGERVYVDVGRNAYGQHAVVAYGVRARPGAPVAVPLDWDEATRADFHPRRYTVANVFRRLGQKSDPWSAMTEGRGSVSAARRRLDPSSDTR